MAEQVATQEAPQKTTQQTEQVTKPDLITRASQFKVEAPAKEVTEPVFNLDDINKISDPVAKEYAMNAYKSFQKGYNQKFQEIASIRKDYEKMIAEQSNWSPERVQSLLQDARFVEAAKSVIGTQEPTEQTFKTENELKLEREIQSMKSKLNQLEGNTQQQSKVQEDEKLKTRYANYDPNSVDMIYSDMLNNRVQATREHLWKVIDYDNAVQRAYELGKQDKQLENKDKISSVSFDGTQSAIISGDKPTIQQGESDRAFLQRIFNKNMQRQGK